jgi:succinate-acetate transporter protein
LRNTKTSIFGGISKFLKLIVFGQILANFGSFG